MCCVVLCANLHHSCAHVNVKLSLACIRFEVTSNQELAIDCFYYTFNELYIYYIHYVGSTHIEKIDLGSLFNATNQS